VSIVSNVTATVSNPGVLPIIPKPNASQGATTQTSSSSPAVIVTLSQAAQGLIAQNAAGSTSAADASKAVDTLLSSSGSAIYSGAISSLKQYPPDLSTRYDQLAAKPTLTPAEQAEALKLNQDRNAREEAAFMHFAHEATAAPTKQQADSLMAQYNKAYVEYYDSLSPAEQNSPRYRGTRAAAAAEAQSWSAEAGQPSSDLSGSQDPILMLFDKIKAQNFKVDDKTSKSVLQDYKDGVSKLTSSQADPTANAALANQAASNFMAVQAVIDKARSGSSDALGQLQGLANDPSSLDTFLSYAQSLSQS